MALVLNRKAGQTVIIDGCVTITVYSAANVRLKIDAPAEVNIRRGELEAKETIDERGAVLKQLRAVP